MGKLLWCDWTKIPPWELKRDSLSELAMKFGVEFAATDEISLPLSSARASQNARWVMKLSFLSKERESKTMFIAYF